MVSKVQLNVSSDYKLRHNPYKAYIAKNQECDS